MAYPCYNEEVIQEEQNDVKQNEGFKQGIDNA
jgi:hypothetical protein